MALLTYHRSISWLLIFVVCATGDQFSNLKLASVKREGKRTENGDTEAAALVGNELPLDSEMNDRKFDQQAIQKTNDKTVIGDSKELKNDNARRLLTEVEDKRSYFRYEFVERYKLYDKAHHNRAKRGFSYEGYYDYGDDVPADWPYEDNRWDSPENDTWNFDKSGCNKFRKKEDRYYSYYDETDAQNVSAYDIYTERCCSGHTYPKYPNGQYSCCGPVQYETSREVCCSFLDLKNRVHQVHTYRPGYTCCGGKYINIETSICCTNLTSVSVKSLPDDVRDSELKRLYSQCCGEELYDTRSHICFMQVSSNFTGKRGRDEIHLTVIAEKYNRTGVCKGEPYNLDTETCDDDGEAFMLTFQPPYVFVHIPKDRNRKFNKTDSCNGKLYNVNTQMCCGDKYKFTNGGGKVWDKVPYSYCCGTEICNYFTQMCCNNVTVEKPNVHIHLECCGTRSYEPNTQWCCKGSNTIVNSKNEQGNGCCGSAGIVYNSSSHVCCNSRLTKIPDSKLYHNGWRCCPSEGAYSDSSIYNIASHQQCCANKVYDTRKYSCCAGKLHTPLTACCDEREVYNDTTHLCCDRIVVEKPSHDSDSCCGRTPYDHFLQTCCFDYETGKRTPSYKKSRNANDCCGGMTYERDKSLCCHWYDRKMRKEKYAIVKKNPKSRRNGCCRSSTYDPETQLCCNGKVHGKLREDERLCCGQNVYSRNKELCCRGSVFPVDNMKTARCCYENDFISRSYPILLQWPEDEERV